MATNPLMIEPIPALIAIDFYNNLLNRAEINLKDAQKRHDIRATQNIERKILIYRYTIDLIKAHVEQGGDLLG